jgi:ribose-phosphate pyrophosphokinase
MPVLCEYIKSLNIPDLILASPDVGFAKTARKFAEYLHTDLVIGDKSRTGHDENAQIMHIIGDVKGKNVAIVDDFSLSGITLVRMAEALKKNGAESVYAAITHMLFNQSAIEAVEESPIEKLIGMDTVDNQLVAGSKKIRMISAAPLFAEAVMRIQNKEGMSNLFSHVMDNVVAQSW